MARFYAASRVLQGGSNLTSSGSFSEYGLLAAAGAEVFGLLIVLRQGHGVGREKLAHREGNVAKQAAGIVGAAAGALLLRHTVVIHRHQQLGIPLQADNGELSQCDIDPAAVVSAAKLAVEALADKGRHFAQVAVAVPAAAVFHDPGVQNDGINRLYGLHQVGMQSSSSLQIARYF